MKTYNRLIQFLLVAVIGLFALLPVTHAQDTTVPAADPAVPDFITTFITSFATSHPWVTTLLAVVGALRLLFKPIMTAIENYVRSTPDTGDDAKLEAAKASPIFKAIRFILDYGASIKIGPGK